MDTVTPLEITSDNSESPETKISKLDTETPSGHSAAPFSIHPYGNNGKIETCGVARGIWEHATICVGSGEKIIAEFHASAAHTVGGGYPRIDSVAEMRANANLFLAAPDMLAALKMIVSGYLPGQSVSLHDRLTIHEAISKAEGRA